MSELTPNSLDPIFEGRILARYGTYDLPSYKWARYLKVDLTDRHGESTITADFEQILANKFIDILTAGTSIRLAGFNVCPKNTGNDGGSADYLIASSPRTTVMVVSPFPIQICFFPVTNLYSFVRTCLKVYTGLESRDAPNLTAKIVVIVVSFGPSSPQRSDLVIADGPDDEDLPTLIFWPCRKADYTRICEAFTTKEYAAFVLCNVGSWKNHIPVVLSVLDDTIIAPVPVPSTDVEVIGCFSVSSLNGPLCSLACLECKVEKINQECSPPVCVLCPKSATVVRVPKVKGRMAQMCKSRQ